MLGLEPSRTAYPFFVCSLVSVFDLFCLRLLADLIGHQNEFWALLGLESVPTIAG